MQLNRSPAHRLRDEGGFTLIELVISVAILGVVSAALFGVVLQYLLTTKDTRARLNESTDQQFISNYWQNDVSSLGRQSLVGSSLTSAQSVFVGSAGPGGCGSSLGSVVVAFAWEEFQVGAAVPDNAWNSTPQEVAYVVPSGQSRILQRLRCRNGVEDPQGPRTVAHNLTGTPAISCDTSCVATPVPNRVSMEFTVRDADNAGSAGFTTTVSADRRQG